jgi:nucleoside-diphosphate-sugar epimerase
MLKKRTKINDNLYFSNMILVTGATGLVGSHLALRLIENGEKVRAIYRNEQSRTQVKSLFEGYEKRDCYESIEWINADLNDLTTLEIAFEGIQRVYHCAALVSFDPKDEKALRKINIEGTANVVNFCLAKNISKLCHLSSIATLGDLKEKETQFSEKSEWNAEKNHSDYAITKYGAEMEVWRGQQEGLSVIVFNPGVILGPGFWNKGSGSLFLNVAKGMPFYTNGATAFVGVDDVVALMIKGMNSEISGERFVVVAENNTFKELLSLIAEALQLKKPSVLIPFWVTELTWRMDALYAMVFRQKIRFSKETARASQERNTYSHNKVKETFGYDFKNTKECILDTVTLQSKIKP